MKFIKTKLDGAFIIELEKSDDERGFFSNMWDKKKASIKIEAFYKLYHLD